MHPYHKIREVVADKIEKRITIPLRGHVDKQHLVLIASMLTEDIMNELVDTKLVEDPWKTTNPQGVKRVQ